MMIYNGFTFTDYIVVEYIRRSMLPSRSIISRKAGGRTKKLALVDHDVAKIEVDVRILGESRADARDIVHTITAPLNVDEPKELLLRDEPDRYNLALLSGDTELHDWLHTSFVTLTFECLDPHLYNRSMSVYKSINGVKIRNNGSADALGVIELYFEDAVANPYIQLAGSDKRISITRSFAEGDRLVVDLESEDIWLNDTTYIPADLVSDFFEIPSGFFTLASNVPRMNISFRERWGG